MFTVYTSPEHDKTLGQYANDQALRVAFGELAEFSPLDGPDDVIIGWIIRHPFDPQQPMFAIWEAGE
jgi:hypothetical protein